MFISHRNGSVHQNGHRFIVLGHKRCVRLGSLDLDFKIISKKKTAVHENSFANPFFGFPNRTVKRKSMKSGLRFLNWNPPRLDYQPLFAKMSPHSSPLSLRGGSKTGPGRRWKSSLKSTLRTDFSEVTFIFGFCVRSRISKSKSGFPSRTQPLIGNLNQVTSYANVLLASRGLLWAWDCWRCITWLRQNHSNSAIRHLRDEKGTGAETRLAIVSGILLGDTRLSLCFKTRVQSYWYENDSLYVM